MESSILLWELGWERLVEVCFVEGHGIVCAYFQTKLKMMRPEMPSIDPNQSIGSDLLIGSSGGSTSARLPKTINPNRALIASCQR